MHLPLGYKGQIPQEKAGGKESSIVNVCFNNLKRIQFN
jgi:hypothetical protein